MKRELAAVALLLLLLAASVANLLYYDGLTDRIEGELKLSQSAATAGDFSAAREAYDRAEQLWLKAGGFTHIFLRHPEVDDATDALFELKQQLFEERRESCAAAFDKVFYHLNCIDGMEHPSLGSVF